MRAAGGEHRAARRADALVWLDSNPDDFPDELPDRVRWVQLPSAGVERWLGRIDRERLLDLGRGPPTGGRSPSTRWP